jgi:TRAP-type mannitol/chloroaromatic compound transport system permease large subunit
MRKNSDTILAVLVLIAAGLVLTAPVLGRSGFPFAADLVVSAAAVSGVGAFLMAAAHSLLHLRTPARVPKRALREDPPC